MIIGYAPVGGSFTPKRFKRNFYFRLTLFLLSVFATFINYCDNKIEQKKQEMAQKTATYEKFIEEHKEWFDSHPNIYGPPTQAKYNKE